MHDFEKVDRISPFKREKYTINVTSFLIKKSDVKLLSSHNPHTIPKSNALYLSIAANKPIEENIIAAQLLRGYIMMVDIECVYIK